MDERERQREREREKGCEWDRVRGRERGLIHKKPMKETVLGVEKVIVQASPFSVPKKRLLRVIFTPLCMIIAG